MSDGQANQQTGEQEYCCCGAPFIRVDGVEWCQREYFVTVLNLPYGEPHG